jgi:hypothetical protein
MNQESWKNIARIVIIFSALLCLAFRQAAAAEKGKPDQGGDLFTIAQIRYSGGGDWYEDRTSLVRLQKRLQRDLGLTPVLERKIVKLTDDDLFSYPMLFITGHGNIVFKDEEAARLRTYLESGGFLWASDDYGMDPAFRREMKKVLPGSNFVELPFSHPIYREPYSLPDGLPKIHEHAGGAPRGYGMFIGARMVVFYDFNTDIGDGLEAPGIHKDPPEKQEQAFKMAVNIAFYALTH